MEYVGEGGDVVAILNGVLAEPGIAPDTAAKCLVYLSHIALRGGDSANGLKFAAIVLTDAVMIAKLRAIRGQLALSQGRLTDARTELDAAIANTNSLSVLIPALLPRAELALTEGDYSAAEADARRLLDLARRSQGGIRYSNRTGLARLALGRALASQGNRADSHAALQAAIEHLSNTVDADHPMLKLARELAGT
jgi:tetratricopeptide (TPR) repeat protein